MVAKYIKNYVIIMPNLNESRLITPKRKIEVVDAGMKVLISHS